MKKVLEVVDKTGRIIYLTEERFRHIKKHPEMQNCLSLIEGAINEMINMKGQMQLYFDEEGDFLEINISEYTKGFFRDAGEGISERIDEKTGKVTGVAILGFKKRTQQMKDLKINLPVKIEMLA